MPVLETHNICCIMAIWIVWSGFTVLIFSLQLIQHHLHFTQQRIASKALIILACLLLVTFVASFSINLWCKYKFCTCQYLCASESCTRFPFCWLWNLTETFWFYLEGLEEFRSVTLTSFFFSPQTRSFGISILCILGLCTLSAFLSTCSLIEDYINFFPEIEWMNERMKVTDE